MILVVALNPSIDVEWRVNEVRWQEKNSILSERRWPGGKGINVTRWLRLLGDTSRLLLPLGGDNGEEMRQGLKAERLDFKSIPLRQETRANIIVTTGGRRQLRFNPLGPKLSGAEWKQFRNRFERETARASLAILSGSLPRGVPANAYGQLIGVARKSGINCLLDCDGEPFAAAIKSKPFLVKPNLHELEQWRGRALRSRDAIRAAASDLSEITAGWVLVSLGVKGALLLNANLSQGYEVAAPKQKAVNTVGAGDAMLAGVAHAIARKLHPSELLNCGVACGSSAVGFPAGVLPPRNRIAQLHKSLGVRISR